MALAKRPFAIAAAANATLFTGSGGLFGLVVRENTGVAAAATLTVFDNTAASGPILGVVRLAADGEFSATWEKGVKFGTGLTVLAAGGDITGSLIVGSSGGLRALPFAGADLLLQTGAVNVDSVLAAETAGAAAEWRAYDALSITGTAWVGYTHAANETVKLSFPQGVTQSVGQFYDQQTGAVSGAVYVF